MDNFSHIVSLPTSKLSILLLLLLCFDSWLPGKPGLASYYMVSFLHFSQGATVLQVADFFMN